MTLDKAYSCTSYFLTYVKLQSAVHHLLKHVSKDFRNVYFHIDSLNCLHNRPHVFTCERAQALVFHSQRLRLSSVPVLLITEVRPAFSLQDILGSHCTFISHYRALVRRQGRLRMRDSTQARSDADLFMSGRGLLWDLNSPRQLCELMRIQAS